MSSSTSRFSLDHSLFAIRQAGLSCPTGRLVREVCLFGVFGVIIRDFCLESYANQSGSRALGTLLDEKQQNTSSNFDRRLRRCSGTATRRRAETGVLSRKKGRASSCIGDWPNREPLSASGGPPRVERRIRDPRVGQPTRREAPPWKLEILERHWVALYALVAVPLLGTR